MSFAALALAILSAIRSFIFFLSFHFAISAGET